MKRRSFALVAAAGVAGLLLSGCSGQAGLKALGRAATPEDKLPAIVTLPDGVNRGSARLLATADGVHYFAAQSDDTRTSCVTVVPAGENPEWHAGCGTTKGSGEIVNISGPNGSLATILQGDDSDTGKMESGWTKIADNILIADR